MGHVVESSNGACSGQADKGYFIKSKVNLNVVELESTFGEETEQVFMRYCIIYVCRNL